MITGSYALNDQFSFDFWINPKYTTDFPNSSSSFKAGTILHLSSSYAVSLVTGSSRDINGYPNGYRLLLQLSSSTDTVPSLAVTGSGLVFLSDDNALHRNNWHHVTIRWGNNINNNSGSFIVDGIQKGSFVISSASVATGSFSSGLPSVLFLGNFFEGTNSGTSDQSLFFSNPVSEREGLDRLIVSLQEDPSHYNFAHPLNAELHEIKIYNKFLNNDEILFLDSSGPTGSLLNTSAGGTGNNLLFYLPPFFARNAPYKTFVGTHGGLLITPFEERNGRSNHPFSIDLSFGLGGHYINLDNFVHDFGSCQSPRLFGLSGSIIQTQNQALLSCNDFLYATGSNIARSLMILPNDNGRFYPNFSIISASRTDVSVMVDDHQNYTPGFVTLRNMLPTASVGNGLPPGNSGSLVMGVLGPSPENLSSPVGSDLTVFNRTQDNTSNQVVFFDISNLYYGKQILQSSFQIIDSAMSNSNGKVSITLSDDGEGNLYRADCLTPQSTWNSVGNVFYNEGLAVIKHPSLYFFGKDQFSMNFRGVQDINVLTYNLMKRPLQVLSSSNPDFTFVSASNFANDTDQRFVYITGINIHDDDMNVIAKSSLAQPVLARSSDKFMFRVKLDF
jgi:hypothetical protein